MGMRRNEKIQIIALYGSLVLIVFGIAFPNAMNILAIVAVGLLVLSWVGPSLERLKIVDEVNGLKATDLVWIEDTKKKPVQATFIIANKAQLIPIKDGTDDAKILTIKRNKDILLRFMPAAFVDDVMKSIDKLQILSKFYCYYMDFKYPEPVNGNKYEHMLLICRKDFDEILKFQDKIPCQGYDVNMDTLVGTSILIEKVGDLPFVFLDYVIEESYESKTKTDESLISAEDLNSIKDQVILTLMNWNMPASAVVRKSDNLVDMYKENFEDSLQTIKKLKFINRYRPPMDIHWTWKMGWVLVFILVVVLIYLIPQIAPTPSPDFDPNSISQTTSTTKIVWSLITNG